jgi:hypothetical protein
MPTLTLEVDDAVLQEAERLAAEKKITVDQLVRDVLADLISGGERRRAAMERFNQAIREHPIEVGERTWTREDLYER